MKILISRTIVLFNFVAREYKNGTNINEAISLIRSGEIVAIPTETVYGLAGNGTDEKRFRKSLKPRNAPYQTRLFYILVILSIYPNMSKTSRHMQKS